jgi:hypothetical protein
MTSHDVTKHGADRNHRWLWVPRRDWLVHVKRGEHRWFIWCPCCHEWGAVETFRDACDVVADILPGVRR